MFFYISHKNIELCVLAKGGKLSQKFTPIPGRNHDPKYATVFLCYVSHGSHMRCGIIDVIISYFQV